MKNWFKSDDWMEREIAWVTLVLVALVLAYLGFLLYLHATGGNVKASVYSFAVAFVASFLVPYVCRRARFTNRR